MRMRSEPVPSWYRKVYAVLLQLYPRGYRQRFGEGMGQVFDDMCRDRVRVGESLLSFALWTFAETSAGILREHVSFLSFLFMQKTFLRPLVITLLILIAPLIGELTVEGWNWGASGFLFMGVLLFVTFLMIELLAKQSSNMLYKIAVALTTLTTFGIIYVNLAVGIIGDGNNTSAMYFLVVPVGFIGLAASRLKAKGLSLTAFAMAAIVLLVPTVALLMNDPYILEEPGPLKVFVLSSIIAASYVVAGLLFRQSMNAK